jgi:hypothetical protein
MKSYLLVSFMKRSGYNETEETRCRLQACGSGAGHDFEGDEKQYIWNIISSKNGTLSLKSCFWYSTMSMGSGQYLASFVIYVHRIILGVDSFING